MKLRSLTAIGKAELLLCIIAESLIDRLLNKGAIRSVFHVHRVGGGRAIADVERSQGGGGETDEVVEAADRKDGPSRRIFFCQRSEGVVVDVA